MAGRKIRDESEATAFLQDIERSGISVAEWAQSHGVDGRSINAWKNILTRRGKPRRPRVQPVEHLRLVELIPAESAPKQQEVSDPENMWVCCGPYAVEVPPCVDEDTLAKVLRVIATC